MAATMTDQNKTCTICFELREVLKIVGPCKHHFCTFCLSSHFERQRQRGDALSCPTCHTECSLPGGGVDQLTDFSRDVETDDAKMANPNPNEVQEGGAFGEDHPKTDFNPWLFQLNCQICHHRGKEVQAAGHCPDCDHLYICEGCTVTHARNKATKAHVVIPLKTKHSEEANEEICAKHRSPSTIYCCTCKEPACKICVQIDHGDHEVQQLSDLIQAKVEEVKVMSRKREQELKRMKILKGELMALRSSATPLDKQDNLIKDIEDHTEKCIEKQIKLKEELKAEVKKKFAVVKEATADLDVKLEMVNESIKKLNSSLEQTTKLLSETKFQTSYLDKVTSLQTDLKAVAPSCDIAEGKKFHDSINKIQQSSSSFIPEEPSTIGSLQEVPITDQFQPKLIAIHTLETYSKDKFIPCLANLGDKFAVAHPTKKGQPSDGVNIYEYPNSLKLTLKADVGPVHDLASTPDGQLAVLSDGSTGNTSCSVKTFDPNTGKNIITHNLDIANPVSLGVNFQNQYVILSGKKQGEAQITVFNDDGSVELEQVINVLNMSIDSPGRITCGWRYIFILVPGERKFGVYAVKGNKLVKISNGPGTSVIDNARDISASVWDHLFLADQVPLNKNIYMMRFIQENNSSDWDCEYEHVHDANSQADEECRISVRGCYTIMSWGQTFAVYQC